MSDSPAQSQPSASAAPAPAPSPQAKKPRKKHWLLRILAAVLVLLLLIALGVQIVLWTDLPRGLVIGQIEKQLGLRVSAASLSTGWLGHTRLQNVHLGLPLSKKAFLDVPVMKVKNTSLFSILIGRPVSVQSIELDDPHLYVRQDQAGRWNLQDVAELLGRVIGKKAAQQSAQTSSSPSMPIVKVVNGTITITDNKARGTQIQPLEVDGQPDSAVEWKYEIKVAPRVAITGRLVPGGNWAHEVAVRIQDVGVWAKPWVTDFPDVIVDVDWRGQLSSGGASGRLDVKKFSIDSRAGAAHASGALAIGFEDGNFTVRPDGLNIEARPNAPSATQPVKSQKQQPRLLKVTLASGLLTYIGAGGEIKAQPLVLDLFGGPATVTADYNLHTQSGQLNAAWNQLALPGRITHSGNLAITMRKPFPNQMIVDGKLNSQGSTPSGPWIATAALGASGVSFSDFDWHVNTGKFEWLRRGAGIDLDGLALTGAVAHETVTLRSISLPTPGLIEGSASYHLTGEKAWYANLRGQHWPFQPIEGTQLAFELKTRGDNNHVTLEDFILKSPDARFSANGIYRYGDPKPLNVNVTIKNAAPTAMPAAIASSNQAKILNGSIEGHAKLIGTISPMDLAVSGELSGREIDIRGHHLGDINLNLSPQSHVDDNGAFIYTQDLKLLGGQWSIDGIYVFDSDGLNIGIGIRDLALANVATLADQTGVMGLLDARINVFLPGLNPNPNYLRVPPSTFKLRNVNAKGVMVDEIDATLALSNGNLQISPITLKRAAGRGDARLAMNVNDLGRFDVGAALSAWPLDFPGVNAHFDAWVALPDAVVELPNARSWDPARRKLTVAAPKIDLHASTSYKGEALGEIIAHAGMDGRTVDLRGFNTRLLGGRVDGQAYLNLDDLLGAKAEFTWERLDLKKLALIFPQLKDLRGRLTGDARLAPATVPRPREPLGLVVTSKIEDGGWRTVPIKDLRVAAYIGPNHDDPEAGWRFVMEDSPTQPSFIHLADGTVEIWGRFGSHARGMTSTQGQLVFRDLELDDLVHAFMPDAHVMPGQLAGTLMVLRAPAPPPAPSRLAAAKMFPAPPVQPVGPASGPGPNAPPMQQLIEPLYGEGRVAITHANLANFGPISAIYNFMNVFQSVNVPEGHGNAQFHLERGALTIERMNYFNRGTEIRAVATVRQIWNIPNSPFTGSGLGTAKPLAKVKLPFLAGFSDALSAIQSSLKLTGVRVDGTLNHYHITGPVGLTDVGDELQRIFVGDARADVQGGAGG